MKRYAFPLTIILLLFAVIALAAPGDKRPAVTSAAIGLGSSSSPTLASVTATTSVTAPAFNSTAADGYHYVLPYNSVAFAGTPSVGMMQTTPTGPQWYSGTEWEGFGGGTWGSITGILSAQTDLQAALDAISAGGITISTGTPTTAGAAYLNDSTHVLTVASTTGYTQFTGSFTAWDTTPDALAFTDLTDAALSTTQTATPIQITGINYPTAVTATGGTAAICTGATADTCGTFSASPGNVTLNQYVSAQHTSSGSNSTAVDTVVTIGGVPDTFTSTTAAPVAQWYYADGSINTDNYLEEHGGLDGTYRLGSSWTPGVNTTITKLSCKIGTFYGTHKVKITLWEYSGGSWVNRACGENTSAVAGWNDVTIPGFEITPSMQIAVSCQPEEGTKFMRIDGTNSASGFFQTGLTYATTCSNTNMTPTTNYPRIAVRAYGQ